MGDPGKLILLETILNVIKQENLLDVVQKAGQKLKRGLFDLEKEFPALINSVRGRGTFLAVTGANPALRDNIVGKLKQKGNFFISINPFFFNSCYNCAFFYAIQIFSCNSFL